MLRLDEVTKTYQDGVAFEALKPTTLTIAEGEHVAIMGASGSGKSTLLNILGLLDRPTSGAYAVEGYETTLMPEAARTGLRSRVFGFVFQAFHLLPGRTVLDNVELGMLYARLSTTERSDRARKALERVGMADREASDPRHLSGGERQRVAIARATAPEPSVLLCDEPTGNLDSGNAARIMDLLAEIHGSGFTVLVVTHDRSVADHSDRILEIVDGTLHDRPRQSV